MKSLLLALGLVLLIPMVTKAETETWVNAGTSDFAVRYVNVDSIIRENSDVVDFSMKLDYIDKSRLDHSIGDVQFNCTTQQIRLVGLTIWNLKNESEELAVDPVWQETHDSELINKLADIVCNWHPTK